MLEVSSANQKGSLLVFLHSQHISPPLGLWQSPALIRTHCSSNDPTLLTSLVVLSAHPKQKVQKQEGRNDFKSSVTPEFCKQSW